jgi:hypothetical protein
MSCVARVVTQPDVNLIVDPETTSMKCMKLVARGFDIAQRLSAFARLVVPTTIRF